MKIFVIPATYNEKENIEKFITIIEEEVFPKIKDHEMYILVSDDNSPDGTGDIVKRLMKKYKNLGVNQGPKKGLGAAYARTMGYAIEKLGADVVMSIDADLQHEPQSIPDFLKKLDEGYDMVIGTRYSKGGSMPEKWPVNRKIFSVTANILFRLITGRIKITDWTGGYRAIRKHVFEKEKNKISSFTGYTFQVAFLYKAILDGFTVGEVPIHFQTRREGDSKIAPIEYIVSVFTYVIKERLKELQRFIKFLFVGGTGFIVQLLFQEGSVRFAHVSHPTGVAIGAETAIISNFLLNNFWTFSDTRSIKQKDNFFLRLIKFNIASFGAIIIQYVADYLAELVFGPTIHLAGFAIPTRILILFPTIIFIVIPMNYVIYNVFIWKTKYLKDGTTSKK